MYLTKEEEKILDGEYGEIKEKMFRILVVIGDIYGADRMIPVSSCQISGVSYKSIGEYGLEFLESISEKGARAVVPSYLNPAGVDLKLWKQLGYPENFARKQMRIVRAFRKMGIYPTLTCTPYLIGNIPRFGEHLAWAESSAVSFANSVMGARTNREGAISALASSICGVTPNYGLHLEENRKPDVIVNTNTQLKEISDFGLLGYYLGRILKNRIPYLRGIKFATTDHLKALGAAMAATGSIALYHVEDLTPEARNFDLDNLEKFSVDEEELKEEKERFSGEDLDAVMIGCPHASLNEIKEISALVKGKKLRKPLWIFTSRFVKKLSVDTGLSRIIEKAGGKIISDTCMVVSPIEEMGFKVVGVNSGKAANYLPNLCGCRVVFGSLKELIEMII